MATQLLNRVQLTALEVSAALLASVDLDNPSQATPETRAEAVLTPLDNLDIFKPDERSKICREITGCLNEKDKLQASVRRFAIKTDFIEIMKRNSERVHMEVLEQAVNLRAQVLGMIDRGEFEKAEEACNKLIKLHRSSGTQHGEFSARELRQVVYSKAPELYSQRADEVIRRAQELAETGFRSADGSLFRRADTSLREFAYDARRANQWEKSAAAELVRGKLWLKNKKVGGAKVIFEVGVEDSREAGASHLLKELLELLGDARLTVAREEAIKVLPPGSKRANFEKAAKAYDECGLKGKAAVARQEAEALRLEDDEMVEKVTAPGVCADIGYRTASERVSEIIEADNQTLITLGLTHEEIAKKLDEILHFPKNYPDFEVRVIKTLGLVPCPWCGSLSSENFCGSRDIIVRDKTSGAEFRFGDLLPHLIREHHFFEGHIEYRIDPIEFARFFKIKKT